MIIRKVSAPFKGVCEQCKKRTLVRLYPYNDNEWFGLFCISCFKDYDNALAQYKDYFEESDYD